MSWTPQDSDELRKIREQNRDGLALLADVYKSVAAHQEHIVRSVKHVFDAYMTQRIAQTVALRDIADALMEHSTTRDEGRG